jgi:hypothetical protein
MFMLLHKLKIIVLCSAVSLWVSLTAQEQRPSVAVLEPVGNASITTTNKMIARGYLEQYIVNSRKYRVVDRNRTNEIMKEHSFSRGGLVDNEKAKDLGKLLQADIVCVSELRREEGNFIAICSLIDVESGEVFASATEFLASDSNMDIRNGIERAAMTLMGVENAREAQARERAIRELAEKELREREAKENAAHEQALREQSIREQALRAQAERERQAREVEVRRQATSEAIELARAARESDAPTEAGIRAAKLTINRLMPSFKDIKINKNGLSCVSTILAEYESSQRQINFLNKKPYGWYTIRAEIKEGKLVALSRWYYGRGEQYNDNMRLNSRELRVTVGANTAALVMTMKYVVGPGFRNYDNLEEGIMSGDDILRAIAESNGRPIQVELRGDRATSFQLAESVRMGITQTVELYDAVNILNRAKIKIEKSYRL